MNPSRTSTRPSFRRPASPRSLAILCILLLPPGCDRHETDDTPPETAPTEEVAPGPEDPEDGFWTGRTPEGSLVRVVSDPAPPRPGPIELEVVVEGEEWPGPLTLDLLSPEMPMHGIVRYRGENVAPGRFRIDAEIPMEGRWAIYVNLDTGADAVGFEFEVTGESEAATPPSPAEDSHPHH